MKITNCLRFACSADPSLNIGTSAYNWAGDSWTFQRRWSGVWGLGGLWGCGLQGFRCSGVEGFWDWVEGFSGVGVQRFGLWRFRGIGFEGSGVYRV